MKTLCKIAVMAVIVLSMNTIALGGWYGSSDGDGIGCGDGATGGDPVDLASGRFTTVATDAVLHGRALNVSLTRHYDSMEGIQQPVYLVAETAGTPSSGRYWWRVQRWSEGRMVETHDIFQDVPYASFIPWSSSPNDAYEVILRILGGGGWGGPIDMNLSLRARDNTRLCPIGRNWTMQYDIWAEDSGSLTGLDLGKAITVHDGTNRAIVFSRTGSSGPLTAPLTGDFLTMHLSGPNQWGWYTEWIELHKMNGETWTFDADMDIWEISDLCGNKLRFQYDYSWGKRLGGITDDTGRQITFTYYDAGGWLKWVTDFTGRRWTYNYDALGNLTTVTRPGTDENPDGDGVVYTYDDFHRMLTMTDAERDKWIENIYDGEGRVWTQTQGNGTYQFSYDGYSTYAEVEDRNGNTTYYELGPWGRILSKWTFDDDMERIETDYVYDQFGVLQQVNLPGGNAIYYEHDASGNTTKVMRKATPQATSGLTTQYSYVGRTNLLETVTDPLNHVTIYPHDTLCRLAGVMFPAINLQGGGRASPQMSFGYNSVGQMTSMFDCANTHTTFTYYGTGDVGGYGMLHQVHVAPSGADITTGYTYDSLHRRTSVTMPNGATRSISWNAVDKVTEVTSPGYYATQFLYNKNKMLADITRSLQLTQFEYNLMDKVVSVTDPMLHTTTYGRNDADQITSVTDPEDNSTNYTYNSRNLLWTVTNADNVVTRTYTYTRNGQVASVTDAAQKTTSYQYDSYDRLTQITYPDSSNIQFGYDACSNITSVRNRRGWGISYTYNELNLITSKTSQEGVTTFTYDVGGRLVSVNDRGNTSTYTYDTVGRLNTATDGSNHTMTYTYDTAGRKASLTYPNGYSVHYTYDQADKVVDISDGDDALIVHYAYDGYGRRSEVTYGNGTSSSFGYNLANRITSVQHHSPSGQDRYEWDLNYSYGYDDVGNKTTMDMEFEYPDALFEYSLAPTYDYDSLYQLTDVTCGNDEVHYDYDAMGNRVSVQAQTTTNYTQDTLGLNQYTQVGTTTYTYDPSGNMTGDGRFIYHYDFENRLVEVTDPCDNTVMQYAYDWQGRRIDKHIGEQVFVQYVYDGDDLVAAYYPDGYGNATDVMVLVYGPGVDDMVFERNLYDGDRYYYKDALGSVVGLATDGGCMLEVSRYDAYGAMESLGWSGWSPWSPGTGYQFDPTYGFTGRELDQETGLYYYRARYYNPAIGRFLQTDPIGYYDSLNLYQYCGNDPVNWVDPSGMTGGLTSVDQVESAPAWEMAIGGAGLGGGPSIGPAVGVGVGGGILLWLWHKITGQGTGGGNGQSQGEGGGSSKDYEPSNAAKDAAKRLLDGEDPGPDWEQRGGENGNYYNKNTGESVRYDDHEPWGKHVDYHNKNGPPYRIFPNGTVMPK